MPGIARRLSYEVAPNRIVHPLSTESKSRFFQEPKAGSFRKSTFRSRRFGRNLATARRTASARETPYFFLYTSKAIRHEFRWQGQDNQIDA
jgi:hypothetical protein